MQFAEFKISELGTVVTGKTPPGSKEESFGGDVYFLTPTDMDGLRVPTKIERTLSPIGQSQLSRIIVPKGVAVSCIGSQMGKSCLIKKPFATNQQINTIVPDESKVDIDFLYYLLSTMRNELFRMGAGAGSTMPILNKGSFESIQVKIPSLTLQKKIARSLSIIDDKIELNNQTNQTLETIAKAIFKEWFIDFGPVNSKANGKALIGIEAEVAALFPNSFLKSEFGMIPTGWVFKKISDVIPVKDGTHDSPKQVESGFPLVTTRHLEKYRIQIEDTYLISELDFADINRRSKVDRFDVLISMIGTVGLTHLVTTQNVGFAIKNIGLFKTSTRPDTYLYLASCIDSNYMSDYLSKNLAGSTQQYISLTALRDLKIIDPGDNIQRAFHMVVAPLFDKITENVSENSSLISIRNTLLPKLISGELNLNEVTSD